MIGKYRHRLVVEELTKTPDGGGGFYTNWQAIGRVWAWVSPVGGSEFVRASGLKNQVTHQIGCKYTKLISPSTRLRGLGQVFNIVSALDVQTTQRELLISAMVGDEMFPSDPLIEDSPS
jgi:SPP1 family predicted phage head-tail adaptor